MDICQCCHKEWVPVTDSLKCRAVPGTTLHIFLDGSSFSAHSSPVFIPNPHAINFPAFLSFNSHVEEIEAK